MRAALRTALWAAVGALVVLTGRSLAYLLAPHPDAQAIRLGRLAGGPRLVVVTLVALGVAAVLAAAVLAVATAAVRQRQLVTGGLCPSRPSCSGILLRACGLWLVSLTAFGVLESQLHARAGLHMSAFDCLSGPVHRNTLPILAALSLLAAALVAAAEHVVVWLKRAVAALRAGPARRLRRALRAGPRPADALAPTLAALALGSRAPPLGAR